MSPIDDSDPDGNPRGGSADASEAAVRPGDRGSPAMAPGDDGAQAAATLERAAERARGLMAHGWMVRTFLKHSPEAEQHPQLMETVRAIFDTARALEARDGAVGLLTMLRKKLPGLRAAAERFRTDAPAASDHENFRQAVRSLDVVVADLTELVAGLPAFRAAPVRRANIGASEEARSTEASSEEDRSPPHPLDSSQRTRPAYRFKDDDQLDDLLDAV